MKVSVFGSLPVGRGYVDGVHHTFDGLCDLPRSHRVLLKLGLHRRLRDELLQGSKVTLSHPVTSFFGK